MTFGEELKKQRIIKNITIKELSEISNISVKA